MKNRFGRGFGWGIVATVIMSALMLVGVASGMSPMPQPIPLAIAAALLGPDTTRPLLMGAAALSHLAYGGLWAGLFAAYVAPVTVKKGLGLGVGLWLVMQVVALPFLGWGVFGLSVTPAIAVATLVLHLVYGAAFGALMDRQPLAAARRP